MRGILLCIPDMGYYMHEFMHFCAHVVMHEFMYPYRKALPSIAS